METKVIETSNGSKITEEYKRFGWTVSYSQYHHLKNVIHFQRENDIGEFLELNELFLNYEELREKYEKRFSNRSFLICFAIGYLGFMAEIIALPLFITFDDNALLIPFISGLILMVFAIILGVALLKKRSDTLKVLALKMNELSLKAKELISDSLDYINDNIKDELLKLKNLYDEVLITSEEYEAKKKQILNL